MARKPIKKSVPKKGSVGRKPINDPDDVAAIQEKIDEYFDSLVDGEGKEIPPTFCGLALALGYSSRSRLWEHSNNNDPISEPIKMAMLKIEAYAERRSYSANPAGAIFILKNRGWTDAVQVAATTDNRITIDFTE
jgi:hypothetical protein